MFERFAEMAKRYDEISEALSQPEVASDPEQLQKLGKEQAKLEESVAAYREFLHVEKQIEDARQMMDEAGNDPELRELGREELEGLGARRQGLEERLLEILRPKDPNDERDVIVEIRAGTGGEEAGLFAADLFRMYTRYAEAKRWKVEVLNTNETGIGALKEVVFEVNGKGAYSRLKFESGVHRVQRVPTTESGGRIHTSTATVAVLAEVDEVDIHIPDADLKIDVYRSAGAGGQNVQKNSTAVRLTHLPTGIVVSCQDERSQLQNKIRAMGILRAKLYEIETRKRQEEQDAARRSQVGSGERSEKIRTYNFPQSRVTDHRIGVSSFNMPAVLDGEIDVFIDELSMQDEADRLSTGNDDDE